MEIVVTHIHVALTRHQWLNDYRAHAALVYIRRHAPRKTARAALCFGWPSLLKEGRCSLVAGVLAYFLLWRASLLESKLFITMVVCHTDTLSHRGCRTRELGGPQPFWLKASLRVSNNFDFNDILDGRRALSWRAPLLPTAPCLAHHLRCAAPPRECLRICNMIRRLSAGCALTCTCAREKRRHACTYTPLFMN